VGRGWDGAGAGGVPVRGGDREEWVVDQLPGGPRGRAGGSDGGAGSAV
jgi:hypothetical protein